MFSLSLKIPQKACRKKCLTNRGNIRQRRSSNWKCQFIYSKFITFIQIVNCSSLKQTKRLKEICLKSYLITPTVRCWTCSMLETYGQASWKMLYPRCCSNISQNIITFKWTTQDTFENKNDFNNKCCTFVFENYNNNNFVRVCSFLQFTLSFI